MIFYSIYILFLFYIKLQSLNVKIHLNIKLIRFTLKLQKKNIKLIVATPQDCFVVFFIPHVLCVI